MKCQILTYALNKFHYTVQYKTPSKVEVVKYHDINKIEKIICIIIILALWALPSSILEVLQTIKIRQFFYKQLQLVLAHVQCNVNLNFWEDLKKKKK